MKERIKNLWLTALRSGKYKQGKDSLHAIDKNGEHHFCCLGVLTDLYLQEHPNKVGGWVEYEKNKQTRKLTLAFDGSEDLLTQRVKAWAGLSSTCPDIINGYDVICQCDIKTDVASLNDSGKRFKTIAKLIEEQL